MELRQVSRGRRRQAHQALVAEDQAGRPGDRRRDREGASLIVVAHRGASGYRPEHTLAAYELGARMGADFIEPDVVSTADGVLVCRHEPEIGGTTDVASRPEFADRRRVLEIDGDRFDGWFACDFTLDELRGLRAVERIPDVRPANTRFDGRFGIPTLEEVGALAAELGVGVIPETKHPSWHRSVGLPLEEELVRVLDGCGVPVILQSFEVMNLQGPARELGVELVQLVGARKGGGPADVPGRLFTEMASADGLADIATYAHWVGPAKGFVDAAFMAAARDTGLKVMPYTHRREAAFTDDALGEVRGFVELGVDGLFTDNPDLVVAALRATRR